LTFHEPQKAVTPGQSAVVLDGDRVLGGGRIVAALHGVRV
jgi:tRNA-specific 2-thiouridylase